MDSLPYELVTEIISGDYAAINMLVCKHWYSLVRGPYQSRDVLVSAVINEHIDVLKYMYEHKPNCMYFGTHANILFYYAIEHDAVNALDWLRSISDTVIHDICIHAIWNDSAKVFKWGYYDNSSLFIKSGNSICVCAAKYNRPDMLKFAVKKGATFSTSIFYTAARKGNKEILEWLISNHKKGGRPYDYDKMYNEYHMGRIIDAARYKGYWNLAKWLNKKRPFL